MSLLVRFDKLSCLDSTFSKNVTSLTCIYSLLCEYFVHGSSFELAGYKNGTIRKPQGKKSTKAV